MKTKTLFTHYYTIFSSIDMERKDVFQDNESPDGQRRNSKILQQFARDLVASIGMTEFMAPIAEISTGVNEAWTVFIGLYESCITMHIYPWGQIEINISSCKDMSPDEMKATKKLVTEFWLMKEYDLMTYSKTPGKQCNNFKEEHIIVLQAN